MRHWRADLIAGATTAVLLVPQAMAYAQLAGVPPAMGLCAASVPLLVYAALGRSAQLAIGPVALDSLLLASAVAPLAAGGMDRAALALLLTFLVGALQLLLALGRLGFVANFLSRPVLSGFTSAAAVLIALSQMGPLLGLQSSHGQLHTVLAALWSRRTDVHGPTLAVAALALAAAALSRRWPRWPTGLGLVALGSAAATLLDLERHGVALVGSVPQALPRPSSPLLYVEAWRALLPATVGIALVSFAESLSVARRFSGATELNANRELLAVGSANLASSWFGGYLVAGGLSRSAVNASAGAVTRWAGVITALLVAATAALLAPLFQHLPKAVLSALVMSSVLGLVDTQHALRLWRVKRSDFWLLALTLFSTLAAGPMVGLAAGVGSSVFAFLVQTTRPHLAILGHLPGSENYRNVARFPEAEPVLGQLLVRIDAQFYFGNVSFLKRTLTRLVSDRPGLLGVILDASGMNQLDSSALDALLEIEQWLEGQRIELRFAELKGPVRDVLQSSGWLARLRAEQRCFLRVHDAVQAAEDAAGRAPQPRNLQSAPSESREPPLVPTAI